MNIYGKKQVDIREDNKSAVIDLLLQKNFTIYQMSEILKLSHTALAKVINELNKKNLLILTEAKSTTSGRPPKIYSINGDCAIACAVILDNDSVTIYYVDMRGFQINESVSKNNFESMEELLDFIVYKINDLKLHENLKEKILKYIYVGIPTADFYHMNYMEASKKVNDFLTEKFKKTNIVVNRNIDYEIMAEKKYGLLKDEIQNAVLVNFDSYFCFSLLIKSEIYSGEKGMSGYDECLNFTGINKLFGENYSDIAEQYREGNEKIKIEIENTFAKPFEVLKTITKYLDINNVILSGKISKLGNMFLAYAKKCLTDCQISYSIMGREVVPALSGAVWMSTYHTLQDVMSR